MVILDPMIIVYLFSEHWCQTSSVKGAMPLPTSYLRELCVLVEDVRDRPRLRFASTRRILLPRVQTSTGQRSFAYSGPAVWNSLPPALCENMSLATFKTKLKTYLFRRSQ